MQRALLEDRFQLKIHRETREMPVYALALAKGGPKLTPNSGEGNGNRRVRRGSLQCEKTGTAVLALLLSQQLGRTVIDRTGLNGKYDFTLEWAPDPGEEGGLEALGLPPEAPQRDPPPPDPNRPSIFTAVQEQLGLRLRPEKGPVELIVIDHAEKPSDN